MTDGSRPRVAVIGLDCADPKLVFEDWWDDLPNLARLAGAGRWGPLRTVDPPVTVPAWTCMVTSRDPGDLGIYGFRNRQDHGYDSLRLADSRAVTVDRLWDVLGQVGKHVVVVGVPPTWPPPAVNGELVSCFLTPDPRTDPFTHPAGLRAELEEIVGPYRVDVENYRSDDRDRILAEIYQMTEQRFAVSRHLLDTRPWDFFMMVEIGVDRMHHGFWSFFDPAHPHYEPGHRYADVVRTYYQYLDDEIGELLERFDDQTTVLVVSDHGGQPMMGAVAVNEWLVQEGYLALHEYPSGPAPLSKVKVDWSRTRAWGEGGHYARLCLNVVGREPEGVVPPDQYDALRDELIHRLEAMVGPDGQPIGTRVHRPEELWDQRQGIPPDLVVYFGDLAWRSNGTVGEGQLFSPGNDTGPDDANHAHHGICILNGPGVTAGRRDDLHILDIAPTVLAAFGMAPVEGMKGKVIGREPAMAREEVAS